MNEFQKHDPGTFGVDDAPGVDRAARAGDMAEGEAASADLKESTPIDPPPEERDPNVVALINEEDVPETN
jgi:hypothetical protein